MVHVLLLVGAAVAIYLACEWFVNAVEWLGLQLKVGRMAVGTVLAAVGTALPESVVTLVAVTLGGTAKSKDIGVGAAMGGPLVLSTVAYAIVGVLLFFRIRSRSGPRTSSRQHRRGVVEADLTRLARDQRWFLAVFVFKVGLGLVAFGVKPWLGILFFFTYAVYFTREIGNREGSGEGAAELEPLKLTPRAATPPGPAVALQTVGTLAVIFASSQVFVKQLEWAGPRLGLSATVTALLLSPIATELPEIMNAVLWVRQGKIDLALANISGAMMIQATVPSGLGILFTPWRFHAPLILAATATMAAIIYLLATMRAGRLTPQRLGMAGVLYGIFATVLFFTGG